jgi:hypothetical protein
MQEHPVENRAEDSGLPVQLLMDYLRPPDPDNPRRRIRRPPPESFEVLWEHPNGHELYTRWPNGQCKWESRESLTARGLTIPPSVLQRGR